MLELKNISFSAENETGKKEILKNINLKIDESFVVITGPNGGGKSTLAKIIAGIITPVSGQILLDGEDITHLSITERAKKGISFAFDSISSSTIVSGSKLSISSTTFLGKDTPLLPISSNN